MSISEFFCVSSTSSSLVEHPKPPTLFPHIGRREHDSRSGSRRFPILSALILILSLGATSWVSTGEIVGLSRDRFEIESVAGNASDPDSTLIQLDDVRYATFVVNSTGDDFDALNGDGICATVGGLCTLRAALAESDMTPGPDIVNFAIPGPGPHTISLTNGVIWVGGPVLIDGYSQPGSQPNTIPVGPLDTKLKIILDGTGWPSGRGIEFLGDDNQIRGLVVQNFSMAGIISKGERNVIAGNFIGTDVTGTQARPNGTGVHIWSADPTLIAGHNTVGGTNPNDRNLISGNNEYGVFIEEASDNVVAGNLIGVDVTGMDLLGNGSHGVLISGFDDIATTDGNLVGGPLPESENIISGNGVSGVVIGWGVSNQISGNIIGLRADQSQPIGNGQHGVTLLTETLVDNNVISGNIGSGVYLITAKASQSRIFRNLIGTNLSTSTDLGNSLHGVVVNPGVQSVWIGDGTIANGNVIVYNGGDGVRIGSNDDTGSGIRVLGNEIYENDGLGIDLNADGVTRNDPLLDQDTGPNGKQNFPEIEGVTVSKSGSTILGTLSSRPSRTYRIEFFSNITRDASGFGEGEMFLGFQEVTTDATGTAVFQFSTALDAENATATATDLGTGDTSEFSGNTVFVVNSTDDNSDIILGDGICDTGDIISTGSSLDAECTLRAAIEEANTTPEYAVVNFDIPKALDPGCILGSGCVISPQQSLPRILRPTMIDGYTQPGSTVNAGVFGEGLTAVLRITLDGFDAGAGVSGISLSSSGSTIRGLNIRNFSAAGVEIVNPPAGGPASNNIISGNFIGTNLDGTAKAPNAGDGIRIEGATDITVGGSQPADRNLISGNGTGESRAGVRLESDASGNSIIGNLIGTSATGMTALPNWAKGVVIEGSRTNDNMVTNNLISGNGDPNAGVGTTCAFTGILIRDFAAMNTLNDNYIGTSVNGANALGNRHSGICVLESGVNNKILGNTISANGVHGIEIRNALDGASGNESEDLEIVGNTIGADESGLNELHNNASGVFNSGAPGMLVDENLISGNSANGIRIEGGAVNNRIIGNKIGTDAAGTVALPNGDSGILAMAAENLIIGTSNAGEGNLISGNIDYGLVLRNNTNGTTIRNNRIGTDVTGGLAMPFALPNFFGGILIEDADNTQIGGLLADEGNVISGNNLDGIDIKKVPNANRQRTTIQGNMIGTGLMGVIPNANFSGVFIESVSEIRIEGNTIAFNDENGVTIVAPAEKNIVTRNSIFQNQKLGIDLGGDGLTVNDNLDADEGANKLMNTPAIGVTEIDGAGDLIVRVTVRAALANASYPLTVEFFEPDVDGEEGKRFLGSATYTAPDAGMEIATNLGNAAAMGIAAGNFILASATDDENNTSEFSFLQIVNPPVTGTMFDFGDAPESGPPQGPTPYGYPTTLLNDGARHVFSSFIRLGDLIDDETDGLPTIQVAGDDQDNLDDDDGIVFETGIEPNPGFDAIPLLVYGPNAVTVLNSVGGVVSAWIDLNRDGDWNDAGEQVLTDVAVPSGPDRPKQSFVVPQTAQPGYTVVRFRFSTQTGLAPTGLASNGEVEDYLVRIMGGTNTEENGDGGLPQTFALQQNYPNPFNPTTTIRYSLPTSNHVRLVVYDLIGREIMVLTDELKTAGNYEIRFDAANLPSGVYFYDISAGAHQARRKMIMIR